jgi:hypothetical protein
MPQYRVVVFGGMDGLLFEDLLVTYTSGLKYPLRVKQGELVPVQIFDPSDIEKSLVVGSLGSYIKAGAIRVEYSDVEQNKRKRKPRVKKDEKPEPTKPSAETPQPVVEQQKPEEPQSVPETVPTDLSSAKTVEDFMNLSFFNKLKFIGNCTDKSVLNELHKKIDSPQLKNNISYRLQEL